MLRTSLILSLLLAGLAPSAIASGGDDHAHEEHADDDGHAHEAHGEGAEGDDHLAELGGLRALHAWINATSGDTALVYVELENTGDEPVMLTGAETGHAEGATLVGYRMQEGEGGYVDLGAEMPVAPGRELVLSPQGLAIRLHGLASGFAEGDAFEMHLETSLGDLPVVVAVEAEDARQHSHAGHAH